MSRKDIEEIVNLFGGFAKDPDKMKYLKKLVKESPGFYQELAMSEQNAQAHQDITTDPALESIPLHDHTFYELMYCTEGSATYFLNNRRCQIRRGDIVVIPPKISHQPLFRDNVSLPYSRLIIWLRAEIPETLQIHQHLISDAFVLRGDRSDTEGIGALFHMACREETGRAPGWQAMLLGLAIQVITRLNRLAGQRDCYEVTRQFPELLDRIVIYIDENLAQKISLTDTAKEFLVSESTISKLFRATLNESFYHFVTQRRILKAKSMLAEGLALQEIYPRVGYSDYSAFYRAFRQEVGITPNQYRSFIK